MNEILWCCHIRGPDDVIAARDYGDALWMADKINETDLQIAMTHEPFELLTRATPAIWPWSQVAHVEDLQSASRSEYGIVRNTKGEIRDE